MKINGKFLSNLLKKMHNDHKDKIVDIRCLGLMAGIEFKTKEIATKTGGIYFRATNNQKLEEIYQEINKLEKTEIEEFKYYNYEEKYRMLILLAIGFIIIEWMLRNTLFKSFI